MTTHLTAVRAEVMMFYLELWLLHKPRLEACGWRPVAVSLLLAVLVDLNGAEPSRSARGYHARAEQGPNNAALAV
jgi:hypothetical protein